MRKRALIVRLGAYGDMIIITPILQYLKDNDYHITLNTSKRGLQLFKHDPRIDKFIEYKDNSVPLDKIHEHWDTQQAKFNADFYCNFSESIECNLAFQSRQPQYIFTKKERHDLCNKNYYDETARWAHLDIDTPRPSLNFSDKEDSQAKSYVKRDKFNILWCLSGSGKNKVYPWTDHVMEKVIKQYPDVHFITIGDERCQILEDVYERFSKENLTELSGKISIRESMCLTKHVDLVISPDTGVLHASGCYTTPKIGLLGHTTIENITKHFINDYSVESPAECAPCYRLIYNYQVQCPIDPLTNASWCMNKISPERVYEQVVRVREDLSPDVSCVSGSN